MIFVIVVAAIFTLDFVIKKHIEEKFEDTDEKKILGNRITIQKFHNTGAILSSFKSHGEKVVAVTSAICAVLAGAWLRELMLKGNMAHKWGLSFMLGGALSNTYDRIKRKYVVDYVSFNSKKVKKRTVIYNISDWFIFAGGILVVIGELLQAIRKK